MSIFNDLCRAHAVPVIKLPFSRNSCELQTTNILPILCEISDMTKSKLSTSSDCDTAPTISGTAPTISGIDSDGLLKSTICDEICDEQDRSSDVEEWRRRVLKHGPNNSMACCMNNPSNILWISCLSRVLSKKAGDC